MLGHVSFGVSDLARAIAFHDAALAPLGAVRVWTSATGAGYGAPGLRPHYGPTYYAAFVIDPDGHRLEAVHQER
jgi:catechol 2,3-dioxygenase-like lactoylglutathione lyase family enzyme